jgi:hypothetical protein
LNSNQIIENKLKISIPTPCHENWNAMTPTEKGRFCDSCSKVVVDFTKMNAPQIQHYFSENKNQNTCGHFKKSQLNATFDIAIPRSVLRKKRSFQKAFLLALFIACGSSLFSCKDKNASLGEVKVVDSLKCHKNPTTLGITIAKNTTALDSLKNTTPTTQNSEELVDGEVHIIEKGKEKVQK